MDRCLEPFNNAFLLASEGKTVRETLILDVSLLFALKIGHGTLLLAQTTHV